MTEAVQNEIEVVTSPSDKSYTSQEIREDAPDGQSNIENINEIREEATENSRKTIIAREARGIPRQRKAARKSISRMHLVIQYEKQESRRRDAERKKQQRRKASFHFYLSQASPYKTIRLRFESEAPRSSFPPNFHNLSSYDTVAF